MDDDDDDDDRDFERRKAWIRRYETLSDSSSRSRDVARNRRQSPVSAASDNDWNSPSPRFRCLAEPGFRSRLRSSRVS